jgi:D123
MSFEDAIELTFPEHWYDDLEDWTIPSALIPLGGADLVALASVFPEFRAARALPTTLPLPEALRNMLTVELAARKGRAFLRTSYGMVKENPFAYAPVTSLRDIEGVLRWPDARLRRFVMNRLDDGGDASLFLRDWVDIQPGHEFRGFLQGRRVVGVCQYPTNHFAPEVVADAVLIRAAIAQLFQQVTHLLPLDDVVIDLYVARGPQGYVARLIELNPMLPVTDAGMFSWRAGGNFDASFRYLQTPTPVMARRNTTENDPWQLPG